MEKQFVQFYSPGTFVSEVTEKEIIEWDVEAACELAKDIKERHGATPYGFQFITRSRGDEDLDSKVSKRSPMHFLGGDILTLADVEARNDSKDRTLISNMKGNGYERVIENRNSWLITLPLGDDDVVLDWPT